MNFNVIHEDHDLIVKICERSEETGISAALKIDRMTLLMDLTATHANGCPLRLAELLDAPAGDFNHDIGGIVAHIDRKTGELRNCFVPRLARPEAA